MEELNILKTSAQEAYKEADDKGRIMLVNLFGKRPFLTRITDRVTSFEDACLETGRDPKDPYFNEGADHEIALRRMELIIKALNEGTVLSFKNPSQRKYYAWFEYSGTGFRVYAVLFTVTHSSAGLGSRLCLHSEELAKYFGTQFIDLINQYLKQDHEN